MTRAEKIAKINAELVDINAAVKNILENGQSITWEGEKSIENASLQTLYDREKYLQIQLKKYKIKQRVLY